MYGVTQLKDHRERLSSKISKRLTLLLPAPLPCNPHPIGSRHGAEKVQTALDNGSNLNPEGAPLVGHSVAMYVAGDLCNALMFLVGYIIHRAGHPIQGIDRKPWPAVETLEVHVYPTVGIDVKAAVDQFPTVKAKCHEPQKDLPLSPFTVMPPTGNHVLVAVLQVVDDETVVIAFEGRTYGYRARLDAAGIPLVPDSNLRVLAVGKRDVTEPENRAFIENVFEASVFRKLAVCLRLTGEKPATDTAAAEMINALSKKSYVYVNAF